MMMKRIRRIGVTAVLFALAGCASTRDPDVVTRSWHGPLPPGVIPEFSPLGYCRSSSGTVPLSQMVVLADREIDVSGEQRRPIRVRLEGEAVFFETLDHETWGFNIGHIAGRGEYLDVELKLVTIDNQLAVHWRETFQHRMYRQGLLRIVGEGLERWCEGRGGMSSSPSIVERTTLD